jgi:hypothetical protein
VILKKEEDVEDDGHGKRRRGEGGLNIALEQFTE